MADDGDLIGRDDELDTLVRRLDPTSAAAVIVLTGDAGTGKTALLEAVRATATASGVLVTSIHAAGTERDIPFAGLHALLDAHRADVAAMTERHRTPLSALLDGSVGTAADHLTIGVAVLELIRSSARRGRVLIAIDDVQHLDEKSLATIVFAVRRLRDEHVTVILSGRVDVTRGTLEDSTEIRLAALSREHAACLADQLGGSVSHLVRDQILSQSGGNPGAVATLTAAALATNAPNDLLDPLPLPRSVAAAHASVVAGLADSASTALLMASAASAEDLAAVLGRLDELDADLFERTELAGLVTLGTAGISFVDPVLRSAVYHQAPFRQRAAAHRSLAAALTEHADRHAWHLGRATLGPDENVAALLESTSDAARDRLGFGASALALQRAAELSPDVRDKARRLVAAAGSARMSGDTTWAQDLAHRGLSLTSDPAERAQAGVELVWVLAWSNHHDAALAVALPLVTSEATDLPMRWEALRAAATIAYFAGTSAARVAVGSAAEALTTPVLDAAGSDERDYADATALFASAVVDPCRDDLPHQLRPWSDVDAGPLALAAAGVAAWLVDEPELAVNVLGHAEHGLRGLGLDARSPAMLIARAWSRVDTGQWDDALEACAELDDVASARHQPFLLVIAGLISATVMVWRGDTVAARAHLAAATAATEMSDSRAAAAWAQRVAGLLSLAEESDVAAHHHLRQLFDDDGAPLHFHASYPAIADLAEAAARVGQAASARVTIDHVARHRNSPRSPRFSQLLALARALLAEPDDAEAHFTAALADPAGERWPFERARVRLAYGEWLRRRRRVTESKYQLAAALHAFEALGAATWITRATREIRAAGVRVGSADPAVAELSPQEHQVIHLAAQGLTNREIGDLLHLSPRTVGAHLYRAFPKLGVSNRRQLRDIPPPDPDDHR